MAQPRALRAFKARDGPGKPQNPAAKFGLTSLPDVWDYAILQYQPEFVGVPEDG